MTVRVLAVPSGHPYVRALAGPGVRFLADPAPRGVPSGQWWPPPALEADWVRGHAAEFDLLHVHFGTEARTIDQLRALVATLRAVGRPLVYTAHDLQHPHLLTQAHHDEQLALLTAEADVVITLTERAAEQLAERFGVRARVIPHPQLAPDEWFARADALRARRAWDAPKVGVHLRAMRANVRPQRWLGELARAVAEQLGGELHVFVNDPLGGGAEARGALDVALASLSAFSAVRIQRRERPDDDALAAELAGLDVSVLPYAHGTHSGWLELCWDLGVPVLTPDVGCITDQHAEPWCCVAFDPDEAGAVTRGLLALLDRPSPAAAPERLALRAAAAGTIRAAHLAAYGDAMAGDQRTPSVAPAAEPT